MKIPSVLFFCTAMLGASNVAADDTTCTVDSIQGSTAEVWRSGALLPLSEAMPLRGDDRIETGAETRVNILCSEGMRITVGPDTSIDLGNFSEDDSSWSSFIMNGVSWFARPLFGEERFEIRTPSAVASVRSTEWFVEVVDGATAVFVDEGSVLVTARDGGALVDADLGIDVHANGTAGPVKAWGEKRIQKLNKRLGFSTE